MLRFGKMDGLRIGEIIVAKSEAEETPENTIRITDDRVEEGWYYNEDTFIPPPPDDTYMLGGTTWVQNKDTMNGRFQASLCACTLAQILVLEINALRDGKDRPKEVDDFVKSVEECFA